MIRVMICDDQEVVRQGLRLILTKAPGIQVVGDARDGAEALALLRTTQTDVILMDLKMPGLNGIQATRQIRERYPEVRVLVLTTYDADEWVFEAIRSGAAGYVLKDSPVEGLTAAIEATAAGKTPVDPAVAGKLFAQVARNAPVDATLLAQLTDREREVLAFLAGGLSNAEIAQRVHLSEGTVRNYVSAILSKLGVTDRTQAAVLAIRAGLRETTDGD
jgi:NarL family two-component system response regulator LiaR